MELETSLNISSEEDGSIEDLFALASDILSDDEDSDHANQFYEAQQAESPVYDHHAESSLSGVSDRIPTPMPHSHCSTDDEEENVNIPPQSHCLNPPLTIVLSSDDESPAPHTSNNANANPVKADATKKRAVRKNSSDNSASGTNAARAPKRKRNTPVRRLQTLQDRNKRSPSTTVGTTDEANDSDIDLVSNSVGDITLAQIEQLEADELLARQLQSAYDTEEGNRRRQINRHSGPRRINRSVRHASAASLPQIVNELQHGTNEAERPSNRSTTRRSARTNLSSLPNDRRSHHTRNNRPGSNSILFENDEDDSFFNFFANPRRVIGGIVRDFSQDVEFPSIFDDWSDPSSFLEADTLFPQYRRRQVRRPVPSDVAAFINRQNDHSETFEAVLEMAEQVGEADVGLQSMEIEALTTSKVYTSQAGRSSPNEKEMCSVCMADYEAGEPLLILPCIHNFHKACISRWLKNKPTCPICRVDVRRN